MKFDLRRASELLLNPCLQRLKQVVPPQRLPRVEAIRPPLRVADCTPRLRTILDRLAIEAEEQIPALSVPHRGDIETLRGDAGLELGPALEGELQARLRAGSDDDLRKVRAAPVQPGRESQPDGFPVSERLGLGDGQDGSA